MSSLIGKPPKGGYVSPGAEPKTGRGDDKVGRSKGTKNEGAKLHKMSSIKIISETKLKSPGNKKSLTSRATYNANPGGAQTERVMIRSPKIIRQSDQIKDEEFGSNEPIEEDVVTNLNSSDWPLPGEDTSSEKSISAKHGAETKVKKESVDKNIKMILKLDPSISDQPVLGGLQKAMRLSDDKKITITRDGNGNISARALSARDSVKYLRLPSAASSRASSSKQPSKQTKVTNEIIDLANGVCDAAGSKVSNLFKSDDLGAYEINLQRNLKSKMIENLRSKISEGVYGSLGWDVNAPLSELSEKRLPAKSIKLATDIADKLVAEFVNVYLDCLSEDESAIEFLKNHKEIIESMGDADGKRTQKFASDFAKLSDKDANLVLKEMTDNKDDADECFERLHGWCLKANLPKAANRIKQNQSKMRIDDFFSGRGRQIELVLNKIDKDEDAGELAQKLIGALVKLPADALPEVLQRLTPRDVAAGTNIKRLEGLKKLWEGHQGGKLLNTTDAAFKARIAEIRADESEGSSSD